MKILVANLGSTSFKYRLFDMDGERVLARGGVERIGSPSSPCFVEANGVRENATVVAKDHAVAVRLCLEQLCDPKRACLKDAAELAELADQLKIDLEKNDRFVLSMATLKKIDDIEKLAKRIRSRLRH